MLDYKKISDVVVSGIDFEDYPDFCDTYPDVLNEMAYESCLP